MFWGMYKGGRGGKAFSVKLLDTSVGMPAFFFFLKG